MSNENVATVRNAYAVAERKDLEGWIRLFTPDGIFTDRRDLTRSLSQATGGLSFPAYLQRTSWSQQSRF